MGLTNQRVVTVDPAWARSAPTRHGHAERGKAVHPELAEPPHVLVGWIPDPRADPIAIALARVARVTFVDLDSQRQSLEPLAQPPIDVLVVSAAFVGTAVHPLLCDPVFGLPESVFVVDHEWSPERFVLESMGLRYVVSRRDLIAWLPSAVAGLGGLSRARRIAHAAAAGRPPVPDPTRVVSPSDDLALHAAETRFREAYFRLLLARHNSRRQAAAHARVPYRSFCAMLRKLRI